MKGSCGGGGRRGRVVGVGGDGEVELLGGAVRRRVGHVAVLRLVLELAVVDDPDLGRTDDRRRVRRPA